MVNYAIIVAAGEGKRFGQAKQFFTFRGRFLLEYVLETFEKHKNIDHIILVTSKTNRKRAHRIVTDRQYKKIRSIVSGGKQRQDSVRNGLKSIKGKSGIVIIHDGVRPIVSPATIKRGIKLCKKYKAVIFGIPIFDTIKQVNKHVVFRTVPRGNLYLIQTPQFFEINLLRSVYKKADLTIHYTDEAAIFESLDIPVYLFRGDRFNIKITEKSDLKVLNKLLA